jgi:RNA polymerase sigma factor (sigma-70 family)
MSSDEQLALRAARGDQRAFEQIYRRYHQALYRFCLGMVGNPQDAQDVLQNTMVKVLRALPGEKRKIQLKPWLYRIARNESVEALRGRRDGEELGLRESPGAEVAEVAETRERLRTLLTDLEQLPERQRAALVMREMSGLDFAQIGASFGSTAAVARQTLYEARLSLRQLEAGREMRCAEVMRELSDADGRVARRREIRAHLRSCADCRGFRDAISKRHKDLSALAPLPVAASAGLLHSLLGGKAAGAGGSVAAGGSGIAGSAGAGAGKAVATSVLVKSAATVVVAAIVGASAADRGGLIDLPLTGKSEHASQSAAGAPDSSDGRAVAGPATAAALGAKRGARERRSNHDAGARGEDQAGKQGNDLAGHSESTSRSQSGLRPPGGGYGRSASDRHGRPTQLPEAAARGQGTASSHKPPHATSPPAGGSTGRGHGGSTHGGGQPAAKGASPGKAQDPHPAPTPPQPSAEASPQANDSPAEPPKGGNPQGPEG